MRIFPLGDSALTIELGNELSIERNDRAIALARHLSEHPLDGMIEAVPAYASVTVFYDPRIISFGAVRTLVEACVPDIAPTRESPTLVEIPIRIGKDVSPDIDRVAEHSGLDETDVLDIFLSQTYRVYMLGFLPGFAYMGEVDERIAAPRLETPRTRVPQGSIGIAGKQTGIYPLESPGGWNIIGRTDLKMFDPAAENPCLLKPGEEVRFFRC